MNKVPAQESFNNAAPAESKKKISYSEILKKAQEDFREKYDNPEHNTAKLSEFNRMRTLGTGSFGRVVLVQHKDSEDYLAMKIIKKKQVIIGRQVEHTLNEKRILQAISFPFLVKLRYHFKDDYFLYMVLEFVNGGELFTLLRSKGRFDFTTVRLYSAQIVLSLEYLHSLDIIYRDLKPENILIDSRGFLKVTDFGFAKIVPLRTYTLCGTPEYLAPEIILSRGYNRAVDWWALGILIYEMVFGFPPFNGPPGMRLYESIMRGCFKLGNLNDQALRNLLTGLIQRDLSKRLGNLLNKTADVKNHPWFNEVNWMEIYLRESKMPFVPNISSPCDASNFEHYDEEEIAIPTKGAKYIEEFKDF